MNSSSSGKEGLRQLTLLQDKDTNSLHSKSSHESLGGSTRPLTLGKKQKTRRMNVVAPAAQDENSIPEDEVVGAGKGGTKPLMLARSETSKQRAILRKNEVLPEVVVRPPSMTEHASYAYRFDAV